MPSTFLAQDGDDVLIRVKAVPGASRDEVAGPVGDRLKVRVTAPPEAGRANKAICVTLARALSIKPNHVSIETGATSPEKTVRVIDCQVATVKSRLMADS